MTIQINELNEICINSTKFKQINIYFKKKKQEEKIDIFGMDFINKSSRNGGRERKKIEECEVGSWSRTQNIYGEMVKYNRFC